MQKEEQKPVGVNFSHCGVTEQLIAAFHSFPLSTFFFSAERSSTSLRLPGELFMRRIIRCLLPMRDVESEYNMQQNSATISAVNSHYAIHDGQFRVDEMPG